MAIAKRLGTLQEFKQWHEDNPEARCVFHAFGMVRPCTWRPEQEGAWYNYKDVKYPTVLTINVIGYMTERMFNNIFALSSSDVNYARRMDPDTLIGEVGEYTLETKEVWVWWYEA